MPAADVERHQLVDRPFFSITNCEQVPGFSPRFAAFEANVFHVAEYELLAVKCSTITRGRSVDVAARSAASSTPPSAGAGSGRTGSGSGRSWAAAPRATAPRARRSASDPHPQPVAAMASLDDADGARARAHHDRRRERLLAR